MKTKTIIKKLDLGSAFKAIKQIQINNATVINTGFDRNYEGQTITKDLSELKKQ